MRKAVLIVGLSVLAGFGCSGGTGEADLIFHNGFVWTVDEDNPEAQAVAVTENVISAVGTDAEILGLRGPETQVIDLDGALLLPGFNDNHTHFASAARFLEFNVMATSTQDEFVRRVEDVVSRLNEGEWIVGGFWGAYDQWALGSAGQESRQPFVPDMARIEELTAAYPMFIRKFDNREFAVNRAALVAAGLDPESPRAEGVVFERNRQGELTRIVRGKGVNELFSSPIPPFSHERRLAQTRHALGVMRRHGVTNISDMSDDKQLEIFRELRAAGELTSRIHFRYPLDRWQELADQGIRVGSGDAWIRLGSLKGHIDGIMGTSSARFFEPYSNDPGNRGRWRRLVVDEKGNFAGERFLQLMKDADKAGLQLTVHAIGDEANALLLEYLAEVEKENGPRDRRFRLVHAQVMRDEDFPRLGELDVIAEVQPFHLSDDMRWMEERIGHERCAGAYAFRSILDGGAVLSFGTDWPGTSAAEYPINPMLGLYAALTRQTVNGEPSGGWFSQQRIGIQNAVKAYTYNTAYANFEEDIKGSIEVGKLADLTVLSENILDVEPARLLETRVLFTVVDGRIVYSAAGN